MKHREVDHEPNAFLRPRKSRAHDDLENVDKGVCSTISGSLRIRVIDAEVVSQLQ